jgi:hypothetical protein
VDTDNNGSFPAVYPMSGTWSFTSYGEKNKARLIFYILSATDSSGTNTFTGSDVSNLMFDIH